MQKCKYLDKLGLKRTDYGTNFVQDKRRNKYWKKQRRKYGFDEREVWNLDKTFIEWLYTHIKMYEDTAPVDLEYHKILYKGEELTQLEAMDQISELCTEILLHSDSDSLEKQYCLEICGLWGALLPYMWW